MNYTNLNNQPENNQINCLTKKIIKPITEYITRLRTIFGLKFLIIFIIIYNLWCGQGPYS